MRWQMTRVVSCRTVAMSVRIIGRDTNTCCMSDGSATFRHWLTAVKIRSTSSCIHVHSRSSWHQLVVGSVIQVTDFFSVTVTVMKTFELQLIFGNNCNRYLSPLLLQSKYLITEQNLAVHLLSTLYSQLKRDFPDVVVSFHIPAQIVRS